MRHVQEVVYGQVGRHVVVPTCPYEAHRPRIQVSVLRQVGQAELQPREAHREHPPGDGDTQVWRQGDREAAAPSSSFSCFGMKANLPPIPHTSISLRRPSYQLLNQVSGPSSFLMLAYYDNEFPFFSSFQSVSLTPFLPPWPQPPLQIPPSLYRLVSLRSYWRIFMGSAWRIPITTLFLFLFFSGEKTKTIIYTRRVPGAQDIIPRPLHFFSFHIWYMHIYIPFRSFLSQHFVSDYSPFQHLVGCMSGWLRLGFWDIQFWDCGVFSRGLSMIKYNVSGIFIRTSNEPARTRAIRESDSLLIAIYRYRANEHAFETTSLPYALQLLYVTCTLLLYRLEMPRL
ncbi:hypothetical protein F5X99DRAFT_46721 [Biscogniauxia marginata]|nr:hypothetical protein F5X99DRAFT_46721 [Biscogniauxia marginata]